MASPRLASYAEFWPFYLSQHRHPTCRALHLVGTGLAFATLGTAISLGSLWLLLAVPLAGYAFAWVGHLAYEMNRPATFTYPLWSLRGDFQMFAYAITGRLGPELRRLGIQDLPG